MTKADQILQLIGILRDHDESGPGPKMLPDEILVGSLFWGDLQCRGDFMINVDVGHLIGETIPVRLSRGIPQQAWALIYNYR